MRNLGWLVLGLGIAAMACVLVGLSGGASAWQSGDTYSGSGSWSISNPTVLAEETVSVSGSITVSSGGSLTMYNAGITMSLAADGGYTINVASDGTLNVYDSTITSSSSSLHYKFTVYGSLDINRSSVSETWGDTASWAGGIQIYNGGAQVRSSYIYNGRTGGIYIYNAAATITGNSIYGNGEDGMSATYAFGICMANDGTGTTTSTKVDGNYIYNNHYTSGSYRYGYGVRSQYQSSADTITNNRIYDNGHIVAGWGTGYQLYLSSSTPTVTDDFLGNGSHQLYVTGSSPPQFKNLNMSCYPSNVNTYGAYASNVYLNFSKCSWYMFGGAATVYGVYSSGVSGGVSRVDLTDCNFDYSSSVSGPRYLVYSTGYTPINIWGGTYRTTYGNTVQMIYNSYSSVNIWNAAFNMTLNTASPSFIYVSNYCPVTVQSSTFEAVGAWTGSNFFYGTNYCQYSLNDSKVMIRLTSASSSNTYYCFQLRTYEAIYLNRTSIDYTEDSLASSSNPNFYLIYIYNTGVVAGQIVYLDHSTITYYHPANWPSAGGYNWMIYEIYTPIYIGYSTIRDLNDPFRYVILYGPYTSSPASNPQSIIFDHADINIQAYRCYYIYAYSYGSIAYKTDFYIHNSTIILNNTTPYTTYSSPQTYWYNYYAGHCSVNDSRVELYAGYYIYFYHYGYSARAGQLLYLINSTIISKTTFYYPNSPTSQTNYVYFYYYQYAYVDHFTLDARSGYYMYFYIYAYYTQSNAYLSMRNSTLNIDCKDSVYPSYWYAYAYLYLYYFTYMDMDRISTNITTSYYCYFYLYGYSSANTYLNCTNSVFNVDATFSQYAPYYYGMIYAYHYYWRNAYINNNTYNFKTNYYAYVYMYGYSGANTRLTCTNNTYNFDAFTQGVTYYGYSMIYHYYYEYALVEKNYYNIDTGYYIYNYFYYLTNGVIRNNIWNIRQSVPVYGSVYAYAFYFGGSAMSYKYQFENNSIAYATNGTATGSTPYLFYCYNCDVTIQNVSVRFQNENGTIPMTLFYVYYGSQVRMINCTVDASYGRTSPGGNSPLFPFIYLYNSGSSYPPCTLNITDSTIDVRLFNDAFTHYGFYIYGTNDGLNIVNSTVRWNVSSPSTALQAFRFNEDPSYTGKLNQLSVVNSILSIDVNAPGSMVSLLRMGGGASIGKTQISNANLGANFYVASINPTSLVQLIGLKDVTLRDLVINCNAPPNSDMVLNGIRMERSNAEITNIIVKGNGNGRTSGIICDLASMPYIHDVSISKAWAGIQSVFFSRPTISTNVTFIECRAGIYLESNGNVTLSGSTIANCSLGMQVTDGSWASVIDSAFSNNVMDMELNGSSTAWLLNTTFSKNKVQFDDETSLLLVNWWLQLKLTWSNAAGADSGVIVPNADLVLNDATSREYMRAMTDDLGMVSWFTAAEYSQMRAGTTSYSPYTVLVNFRGFTGQDSVAVTSSTERVIHLMDDSLPSVMIMEPDEGLIQNSADVVMQGVCSDLGSGLARLAFSVDGGAWVDSGRALEAWSQLLKVAEGEHRLGVRVTDMSGNSNETSVGVIIDLTPPQIKISSPADQSLGNVIGVELVGTVEQGSVLTVNHRPVAVKADGSFTYGVRLVEGKNEYSLFATDLAGNTNSLKWTLLLDITPPPLLITGPADGLLTSQKSVMLTGKTEPGASVVLNEKAIEVGYDGAFSVSVELKSGPNPLEVVASDIAGNTARALRTVVLDNEIALNVAYPDNGLVTNQITILARGTTDTDVLLRLNDGLVTVGADGNFSVTFTLSEGSNELVFSAVDRAGNSAQLTRRVVLDTARPSLELSSPQDGAILRDGQVTVSGICEPGITLTVNGDAVPTDTGQFSKTLSVPEGTGLIAVEGRDAAGNTVSVQLSVLVDTTAPPLELVEPATGFRTREYSVIVVGLTEPGSAVTINGQPVMVDPFGKFTTTVTVQKGKNDIRATATDGAGNSVGKTITVEGTSAPEKPVENTWWWAAAGLVVALGIMLPLMALVVGVALKERKGEGGSK